MKKNIEELNKKFKKIQSMGWIEATSHGNGNVGITFENIIGKERENFPIADYNGIEIKTNIKTAKRPYMTLFSSAPDGKYLFQTQLLKEKYGKPDNTYNEYKVFYGRITANKYTRINKYYMKLEINYKHEKIYLKVYDLKFNLIDKDCFWDFSTIKQKLEQKIKILAYITAEKKFEHNQVFFKYKKIEFYKIKSFEEFLKLFSYGTIKICFKVGIYKKGKKFGKTYDHGTGFEIEKENILKLYEKY